MDYNPPDESWYESYEESLQKEEEDAAWEAYQKKKNPLVYRIFIGRCSFCLNSIWSNEMYFEDEEEWTCHGCFE